MTLRVAVLPDAELLALAGLLASPEALAIFGTRMSTALPPTPVHPLLTVHRIGGVPAERHVLDRARLQVDVWADTREEASEGARIARAVLLSMEGFRHHSGSVTAVEDDLGLAWLPDSARTPPTPRVIFGVAMHLRSA